MRKEVYMALVAMAVGAVAISDRFSSTHSREPKTPQQTAIMIGNETFLASQVYRSNGGLCAKLPNGDEVYGFEFVSQLDSSMTPGNVPHRVSTK